MVHQREHERHIQGSSDLIRVRFTTDRGRVLIFTVQYEAWIDGLFRPVVRFDSQHERPHRDILGWSGETVRKDWDWEGSSLPLGEALGRALDEIVERWYSYRIDFLRRKP